MGAMSVIDQVMGRILIDIENGDAGEAIGQWRYLANSLGKCSVFCGPNHELCIQTCGACLIAKLVGEANTRSVDGDEGERYITFARELQALIEAAFSKNTRVNIREHKPKD